ncbi:flagellar hook assembly protein FlgD [Pseudogracilibacillus auburnensis]|uniref:Flagellar basal-body rod modification protein FlgD n=1 Tax=Pseudogracilibacillus auburnensis TaxID=1494959 RepID=A0A2V3W6F7_9BACI|nr:flagellar hook assembly protein FlgD [Pseudogracilibacillus auburnensis]MBO1003803.1 flagellar hook assembly protein FlgD [Pseudogracilibacillus auburnensis]PXW88611.1 flagellar basal-body rod modification protein FlgD [Pseudogracilibacillus auburnensis]
MNKIDSSLYLSNQPKNRAPSPNLGKDEFIKILMTQLQNQDPLNPMEDKEFIAQMATFSQLEQMMHMASSIDTLVHNQLVSPVIQYSHMIGKEVTYESENEKTGEKSIVTSQVVAVSQKDGWAILELDNGEKIYADSVLKVKEQQLKEGENDE